MSGNLGIYRKLHIIIFVFQLYSNKEIIGIKNLNLNFLGTVSAKYITLAVIRAPLLYKYSHLCSQFNSVNNFLTCAAWVHLVQMCKYNCLRFFLRGRILFLLNTFFLVLVQKKKLCDVWQPTLTIVRRTATRKGREKEEGGEKALLLFSVLRLAAWAIQASWWTPPKSLLRGWKQ